MIHTGKLKTATIYLASAGEGIRDVYRETGADLVMTGHWWGANGKPTGNYKVSGTLLSREWTSSLGMGWQNGGVPTMGWGTMQDVDNFLCTVPLLYSGAKQDVSVAKYGASVCRPCARPAFGFRADGTFVALYEPIATLDQMQDKFLALGVVDALCLDGGGSGKWMDKNGAVEDSNRWLYNYVCFWFEDAPAPKLDKGDKRMKICIDAGHGAKEMNQSPDGAYIEHEFTLDMANRIRVCLVRCGVDVKLTREDSSTPSLTERANIANAYKADLFVSLHSNAIGGSGWSDNTRGLTVWTYAAGGERDRAAKLLLAEMKQVGVQTFGSELYHQKFTVLAKSNMPAYLIEYAFHTSRPDVELLLDSAHRDKLALATAKAICVFGGVKWIDAPTEPTKPADGTIYRVQVGAFSVEQNATRLMQELEGKGYKPFIVKEKRI